MNTVRSKDGTEIAYTHGGDGAAVVLVGGGLDDGSENAVLVPALAGDFHGGQLRQTRPREQW